MVIEDVILSLSGLRSKDIVDLINLAGSPKELLELSPQQMFDSFGIPNRVAIKIHNPNLIEKANLQCEFAYKNDIRILALADNQYPKLLANCPDAPSVIYVKGDIDFNENSDRWLSFVGTRNPSTHGEQACGSLIEQISKDYKDVVIVSGLAYGIDSKAHSAALRHNLKTVAVVAHGLETIQPTANYNLAKSIVENGGAIVTEYPINTTIFKHNFTARNRIVAGISSGTVVVESPLKGGSMITAKLANDYNREIFALPGRYNDNSFAGCNNLIKSSIAQLIQDTDDIAHYMKWKKELTIMDLFSPELDTEQQRIYDCFQNNIEITADEIIDKLDISLTDFYRSATMLELNGCIKSVRGKVYIKK